MCFLIADSDSFAIQVESSKGEEENFYTSFLVGLVRGLSDDARLHYARKGVHGQNTNVGFSALESLF